MINEISIKNQNFIYKNDKLSNEDFLICIRVNLIDLILSQIKYQNTNLIDTALNNTVLHAFLKIDGREYQTQYFVNVHSLYSQVYKHNALVTVNTKNSVSFFYQFNTIPDAFEYNGDTYVQISTLRKVFIERIVFLNLMSDSITFQLINEYSMKLESRGEAIFQQLNMWLMAPFEVRKAYYETNQ